MASLLATLSIIIFAVIFCPPLEKKAKNGGWKFLFPPAILKRFLSLKL